MPVAVGVLVVAAIIYYAWSHTRQLPVAATRPEAIPTAGAPRKAGTQAPAFSVQTPQGPITSDTLAGKPYMLELFATWCPHCQRMTAVLRALRAQLPESRFAMVSIDASPYSMHATEGNPERSSQADVDQFDQMFNVTWPTAFDPDLTAARTWGLSGFPQIYIVNAKGIIVFANSGEVPASTLLAAAKKAGA